MTSLDDPAVRATLDRLHARARAQQRRGLGLGLGLGRRLRRLRRKPTMEEIAEQGRTACLSITPVQGQLLYGLARLLGARSVVEFGTSLGVSTIYLACAVRDNGGGAVIGTELLAEKAEQARASLRSAGLSELVDVRVGDARVTLSELPAAVDLLFLDGDKGLYGEVLAGVVSRLRGGGVVVADNIFTFSDQLRPYTEQMRRDPDFWTMTLPFEGGMELSLRLGG